VELALKGVGHNLPRSVLSQTDELLQEADELVPTNASDDSEEEFA
jgi:hypothetical protein